MGGKKGKKLSAGQVERHMEAYSEAVTARLLDEAFGNWENSFTGRMKLPDLDRADHIIIGGRTASELLVERFNHDFPTMLQANGEPYSDYLRTNAYANDFYKKNGKRFVNQMVTEAMMRGETVEVFVPDKATGRIKDEPMKLTPGGYEAAGPLAKPAQLTRWQKFWNKLGFYRKEKAAVVNYEKEMAARNKVKFCNKTAVANLCTNYANHHSYHEELAKYHPEMLEDIRQNFPDAGGQYEAMGEANGFKTTRSSFASTAICVLATKRDKSGKLLYTNEQLFDMSDPNMQKARADAIKEVYDHYKPGGLVNLKKIAERNGKEYELDPKFEAEAAKALDWLVDLQHDAANVLVERINDQAGKLDFSRPDLTEQKGYREFAFLSDTAFDQSQDMVSTKTRMDEKYGEGAYWEATGKVGACSQPYREIGKAMLAQRRLVNGIPGKDESIIMAELALNFKVQAVQQHIAKTLKENPGMKYCDAATDDVNLRAYTGTNAAAYDDELIDAHRRHHADVPRIMEQSLGLATEYIKNPERFSRQIQNGVLVSRIKLQGLAAPGTDKPARFEIRDAMTVERELTQRPAKVNDAAAGL